MKRIFSVLCVIALLLALAACQKTEDHTSNNPTPTEPAVQTQPTQAPTEPEVTEPPQPEEYKLALDAIASDNIETAYRHLLECENKTDKVQELISCFAFVPTAQTSNSNYGKTLKYTYDTNGYLLKYESDNPQDYDSTSTSHFTHNKYGDVLTENTVYSQLGSTSETSITRTYDESRRVLTEHTVQTMDGYTRETEYIYTYDSNGNILTTSSRQENGDLKTTTYTYEYDQAGHILSSVAKAASGSQTKTTRAYDNNGNLVKERCDYSSNSWLESTYTYDENGKILTETNDHSSDLTTSLNDKIVCTYDENGNLIRKYTEKYGHWTEATYTYDSSNNLIERVFAQESDWVEKDIYTYNENGNRLTQATYQNGSNTPRYYHSYTYDEFNNIVQIVNGTKSTTTYTYQLFYYPNGVPAQIQDIITTMQMQYGLS